MIIESITAYIRLHQLIQPNDIIIIGLSGGPDSVFLTLMLSQLQKQYSLRLIAAHLDHEWRPDSARDVALCQALCKQLDIELVTATRSTLDFTPTKDPGSQEALGRMMRRTFFEQLRKQYHANSIALAHHRQDQEETFFIRLIRGTTLDGLTSMRPKHGAYIRPLLEIDKTAIIAYLEKHAIPFMVDPTNLSDDFLRNRIRNTVIPALHACDERFDANFTRTLTHLQQANQFIEQCTEQALQYAQEPPEMQPPLRINLKRFFATDPLLQTRMIMLWLIKEKAPFTPSQALIKEILRFLASERGGTHELHEKWQIKKVQNSAHIVK